MTEHPNCMKIVLTGGPGGGKTTAADLFRRELGERVVVVPEAATLLYAGGFPRAHDMDAKKATQRAIFHVQRSLEDVRGIEFGSRVLLCDRGTVDGGAYWPGSPDEFFSALGTTHQKELNRYDAVLFFETAAVGGLSVIESGNPVRTESIQEALKLDLKLRELWKQHSQFILIPHNPSFVAKISIAMSVLSSLVRNNGD